MGNPTRELTLRVPEWLSKLVRDCAAHCGLDVSDVVRRTARWASRNPGRGMSHIQLKGERVTKVIRARDVELPDGMTPERLRNALAAPYGEAMKRPSCKEVNINLLCMYGDGLTPQAIDKTEE